MNNRIKHDDIKEDLLEGITEEDMLDAVQWAEDMIKTLKEMKEDKDK